jgi:hypothetical protein
MSANWKKVTLTAKDVAGGAQQRLLKEFSDAYMAAAKKATPEQLRLAAMFARDRGGDIDVFFSPNAVAFFDKALAKHGAVDAKMPPRARTSLLMGDQRALELFKNAGAKGSE